MNFFIFTSCEPLKCPEREKRQKRDRNTANVIYEIFTGNVFKHVKTESKMRHVLYECEYYIIMVLVAFFFVCFSLF